MTKTKQTLAAAILLSTLAVTACTQPDPRPTVPGGPTSSSSPSPSATTTPGGEVPKPANADEAKEAAWEVVEAYWTLSDQIAREKGTKPERIMALANGAAADYVKVRAAAVAKSGFTAKGERKVTEISSYTSTLKGSVEVLHGNVGMKVCNDVSGITWYKADGTPDRRPDILRTTMDVSVIYDVTKGGWRIDSVTSPKTVKPC